MPTISLTLPAPLTQVAAGLHSANYSALQVLLNGGLDAANFAAGQILAPSKLTQGGAATGQALAWNGTQWAPATIQAPGYSTGLPGSPVDGQEHVLVDSTTSPTYAWRFRYNAGSSSAYKWEFIGGSSLKAGVGTSETTASTSYVDLATVGPSITVPRAGEYELAIAVQAAHSVGGSSSTKVGVKIAAAATGDFLFCQCSNAGVVTTFGLPGWASVITVAASDVVKLQYATVTVGTATFVNRALLLRPIRVS